MTLHLLDDQLPLELVYLLSKAEGGGCFCVRDDGIDRVFAGAAYVLYIEVM